MKKILTLIFAVMSLTLTAQVYKFETVGNFFVVTDTVPSPDLIVITMPVSNMYYLATNATTISLFTLNKLPLNKTNFTFSTIIDSNEAAFSSYAVLIDWLRSALGGSILAPNRSYNFVANANKTGAYMRGNFTVQSQGTYGSGSMNLQYSYDNTDWTTISTFTTDTVRNIEVAGYIRTTLTGATSPNLDVTIQQIK